MTLDIIQPNPSIHGRSGPLTQTIGDLLVTSAPSLPHSLKSSKQEIVRKIHSVIGYDPISECRLQFAPGWITYESIQNEKNNYKAADAV